MMRRLNISKKRARSASIAVPSASGYTSNPEDSDDDRFVASDDVATSTATAKAAPAAPPLLTRSKSERRYQSTGNMRHWTASDLEDLSVDSWQRYHLRCFSVTPKGVVSRGDIVRYRRVRSLSLVCQTDGGGNVTTPPLPPSHASSGCSRNSLTVPGGREVPPKINEMVEFTVYLIGSAGVGKTALTQQFTTSEHILNSKKQDGESEEPSVRISLDGEESKLIFREITEVSSVEQSEDDQRPYAFLVVYSVAEVESFLAATYILCQLQQYRYTEDAVIILVGNKSDLVRGRVTGAEEGQMLAASYKVKFIETSVGINYNVDELLVGVLTRLRKLMQRRIRGSASPRWNRFSRARSSIRRMIGRVLKKDEEPKLKCDIFRVN